MPTGEPLVDFDWVTARSTCSITSVFVSLVAGLKADVAARNALPKGEKIKFGTKETAKTFTVYRENEEDAGLISIMFSFSQTEISVSRQGTVIYTAVLTLTNLRQCRLLVNGEELEEWQFRKMALESLFFGA